MSHSKQCKITHFLEHDKKYIHCTGMYATDTCKIIVINDDGDNVVAKKIGLHFDKKTIVSIFMWLLLCRGIFVSV